MFRVGIIAEKTKSKGATMEKKISKRILALVMLMVVLTVGIASAGEPVVMPDIEESVDLTISYTYDNEKIKLDGAEISIYKVADVETHYGNVKYTLDEYYAGQLDEDFIMEELTEETSKGIVKKLSTGDRKADHVTVTDREGNALFKDIVPGIYLVAETAKSGTARNYQYFGNFLISVPMAEKTEGYKTVKHDYKDETEQTIYERTEFTGKWNCKVFAYPKTETVEVPTPPHSPKTGDETDLGLLVIVGAIGLAGCFITRNKKADR